MPRDLAEEKEEENVRLNVQNEKSPSVPQSARKSLFGNSRSKSVEHPVVTPNADPIDRPNTRRLSSNQCSIEMSQRYTAAGDSEDVVDDAGRREDLDDIEVQVTSSRSFGLSSSFLRRKKDEYEGEKWVFLG